MEKDAQSKLPLHLLFETNEVSDRIDKKYLESIFLLLKAYPQTLENNFKSAPGQELNACCIGKKRKLGAV